MLPPCNDEPLSLGLRLEILDGRCREQCLRTVEVHTHNNKNSAFDVHSLSSENCFSLSVLFLAMPYLFTVKQLFYQTKKIM